MPTKTHLLISIINRMKQLDNEDSKKLIDGAWDGINPKTKLSDDEELDFLKWYFTWATLHNQSKNPDARAHHYDYRGYWKENPQKAVLNLSSDHLPDTYKTPGHPTFSVESKYFKLAPGLAGHWEGKEFIPPQKVDLDRIRLRQRYAESTFDDKLTSQKGAKGAFQIMPKTYEQYAKKIGEGDLFDPEYNGRMRDAIWEDYYNSKTASNGTPTDAVRVAKALAMYNAGWGRVGDWLDEQKKAGVDIYGSLDWVDKMPWKETRDYVNFILNEKDTGSGRTNAGFEEAVKKYGYAEGGKIFIKPENRGKFTALKERTGHSATWFKENGTPAQRKMATFALNSRHWKHADGGLLHTFDDGGDVEYYDTINPAIVSASLPDPRSGKGNQIAYNMAQRVRNGELLLKDVPRSYQNYVEGIVAPGGSLDVSKAIVDNGVPIAAPIVGAAAAGPIASALSGVGTWLANPANQMTAGKFALPLLTGATVDQAFQKYTPYNSFGDAVIRDTGLDEVMDYALFDPYMRGAVEFAAEGLNPGYYTGGLYGDIAESISRVPSNRVSRRVGKNGFIEEYPYDEVEANRVREDYNPTIEEQLQYDLERGNYTALKPERTDAELIADRDAIKDTQMDMIPKTNPEIQYIKTIPSNRVSQSAVAPYEIEDLGGGYMLKSLMRGNPLEKQISKNGTVNVNNIKALVGKGSKVEQAVVDKVLASEEFAGKKAIDYNKFRKAVQDELITYDRTPETRWEDYGAERLGFLRDVDTYRARQRMIDRFVGDHDDVKVFYGVGRNSDGTNAIFGGAEPEDLTMAEIIERFRQYDPAWFSGRTIPGESASTIKTNTYTFSSPSIPSGSAKHYNENTLGHSRTYTTADEPDVLHVMESQSDWAQQAKRGKIAKDEEKAALEYKKDIDRANALFEENVDIEEKLARGIRPDGTNIEHDYEYRDIREIIERNEQTRKSLLARAKKYDMAAHRDKYVQESYLQDNYTSRQIQENLRYAAEKGQKKMRYPTRETAAKIEGYPERINYYDKNGFKVKEPYEYPEDVAKRIESIQNEIDKIDIDDLDTFAPFQIREGAFAWGSNSGEVSNAKLLAKLRDRILLDRNNLYTIRKLGDDNDMLVERIYNNEKLFDKQVAKYKEKYGHEPELDVYSLKSREAKARRRILEPELKELLGNGPTQLKKGLIEKKEYDYEDILRKYTEFPKQYQKLFKGADVRTVTDAKGNTWYEVDVPENYLKQEWQYGLGGKINRFDSGGLLNKYGADKIKAAISKLKAGN